MNIEQKLTATVIAALNTLYGQEVPEKMVQLQKTKKEFEGHLTLVVFPFLKMSKKGPEQTAQEIGEYLKQIEDKGYARTYLADNRKLYKIGTVFSSETGTISEWSVSE